MNMMKPSHLTIWNLFTQDNILAFYPFHMTLRFWMRWAHSSDSMRPSLKTYLKLFYNPWASGWNEHVNEPSYYFTIEEISVKPVVRPPRFCNIELYYWNKVTVHHLKLCYFLMKNDNTMICGVLLNHCLTVNRIISKSVCLDTRLRDTSLKRCGVKSQFTNSVSCVSIIGVDASLTTTTHAPLMSKQSFSKNH